MKVRKVRLCFENCEVADLETNMFKNLIIDGITTTQNINCYQYENGEIIQYKKCRFFNIEINEVGLNIIAEFENEKLEDRLKTKKDIVSITLYYDNDEEDEIFVKWSETSEYENEYQHCEYTDDGKLKIAIGNIE